MSTTHIIHSYRLASYSDLACRLHVNQLNYSGNLRFIKSGLRNLPRLNYVLFQVCVLCLSPSFSAELPGRRGVARGLASLPYVYRAPLRLFLLQNRTAKRIGRGMLGATSAACRLPLDVDKRAALSHGAPRIRSSSPPLECSWLSRGPYF